MYVCLLGCLFDDYVMRKDVSVDWGNPRSLAKSRFHNRQNSETFKMAQDEGGQWKSSSVIFSPFVPNPEGSIPEDLLG